MRASSLRFLFVLAIAAFGGCITNNAHDRTQVKQNDCALCHIDRYNDPATNPVHVDVFPTTCGICHNEMAWKPANFDHDGFWPLTGAHAVPVDQGGPTCADCHKGSPPVWAGTPRECVGCHRADYDASPYPNHQTFPTSCGDCHSTAAWKPALEGVHPERSFPIRSGHHSGIACTSCHDPSRGPSAGGANTNCIGCHTHNPARVNDQHNEVRGYVFDPAQPNFCLRCHPHG
ncbi:MAG: cytochrome c3 family protein [Polyangiales bacterium]